MYALRNEYTLPELALRRIEEALAFDGQPWDRAAEADGDEPEDEAEPP